MALSSVKIIGLTGLAGAGKDTAAKVLARHGAYVINADKIAHSLYYMQSPVWHELVRAFGSKILNRGGEINRRKLGGIVFSDPEKLRELNKIVHPYLKAEIIQKVQEIRKSNVERRTQDIILNAAVLKEIGLIDCVDEVWVVMASREKRLKRLISAGLSKEAAGLRIRAQAGQKEYLKMADVVIKNDGTKKELNAKVQARLKI